MGKHQRNKGSAYEREVANELTDKLGFVVKRNSAMYANTADIRVGKWVIECKRRANVALLYDALEQATGYCHEPGQRPVLFLRADGKKSLVVFEIDDAIELMRDSL